MTNYILRDYLTSALRRLCNMESPYINQFIQITDILSISRSTRFNPKYFSNFETENPTLLPALFGIRIYVEVSLATSFMYQESRWIKLISSPWLLAVFGSTLFVLPYLGRLASQYCRNTCIGELDRRRGKNDDYVKHSMRVGRQDQPNLYFGIWPNVTVRAWNR